MRRGKEREGQMREKGEGGSLSPINIISMGAQNGLCQQNTVPLSREEHENEKEEWEQRKKRVRYYHGILKVCVLYGTPYISLITRKSLKIYGHHWDWVKNLSMWNLSIRGEYQLQGCNRCKVFQSSYAGSKNASQYLIGREWLFKWIVLSLSNSKELIHECFIWFTFVKKMTALCAIAL